MSNHHGSDFALAVRDYRRARRKAGTQEIMALLTGEPVHLLSYEEVRRKLKAQAGTKRQLKEIPLDAIVGSVGRYADFTRSFLPRQSTDQERWARVELEVISLRGLPPIDVYQIGDAYFVRDGHHRVSVARELDADSIQAYVTEVQTRVPLSPEDEPEDLILKAEYTDFLERTQLDELRPQADLSVTIPGQYHVLEEHIAVHRYFMGVERDEEIPYQEAVTHWYDEVYRPVVRVIRERDLLRDFPDRTETDLYIWLAEHRAALERELGWEIEPEEAATDLVARASARPERVVARVGDRLRSVVTPEELEAGPEPGHWRREHLAPRRERQDDRLFPDVLVPVSGEKAGWQALEQAIQVARREEGRLLGLHVVPSEEQMEGAEATAVQAEFERRCEEAGVPGRLAIDAGEVAAAISHRARWVDLVIFNLAHPPAPQRLARLSSGVRTLVRRCPRPLLAVPQPSPQLNRGLLAYDGSPKANEALFIATYLTDRWGLALDVLAVLDTDDATAEPLERAQSYLGKHKIEASYHKEEGPVAETILTTAQRRQSDVILMGGYSRRPMMEVVLGSAVDQVLREFDRLTLICR